jgi:hypothetical protein
LARCLELPSNVDLYHLLGEDLRVVVVDPAWCHADVQRYQRRLVEARVAELMADPDALAGHAGLLAIRLEVVPGTDLGHHGPVDVSYWLVDGQHHSEAAYRRGEMVRGYWAFESEGWRHEREVFAAFQALKRKHHVP